MYRIQFTGILGDVWYGGQHFTDRDEARAMVRHMMLYTNRFDTGKRANFIRCRVVEVK